MVLVGKLCKKRKFYFQDFLGKCVNLDTVDCFTFTKDIFAWKLYFFRIGNSSTNINCYKSVASNYLIITIHAKILITDHNVMKHVTVSCDLHFISQCQSTEALIHFNFSVHQVPCCSDHICHKQIDLGQTPFRIISRNLYEPFIRAWFHIRRWFVLVLKSSLP